MPIAGPIWVQTYLGRQLRLPEFNIDAIEIEDTAIVLSRICRFGARTENFYSVAEHSVRCAFLVRDRGHSCFEQFYALNHEGDESLLGFDPQQAAHEAYMRRFGLPVTMPPIVKVVDEILLATEKRDLMKPEPMFWHPMPEPLPDKIVPWSPEEAKSRFLELWRHLACHLNSPPS